MSISKAARCAFVLMLFLWCSSNARDVAAQIRFPTMGGSQFWTDYLIHHGWRIQKNAVTGHFRLLSTSNLRHEWGSFDRCKKTFDELKEDQELEPLGKTVVLHIHGLGRTRSSMQSLCEFVEEKTDWTALNMSYASTRHSVLEHAQALERVINHLEGVKTVHLVGHSMGNIVVRRYLGLRKDQQPKKGPQIGRIVMLAPPSNGSAMARLLKDNVLFEMISGTSGQELGETWEKTEKQLCIDGHQFGVIAGSTRDGKGMNPLIEGDDDLIVGVEETRLPGAADFLVVPSVHTTIMQQDQVKQAVLKFLEHGFFVSAEERKPIPIQPADTPDTEMPDSAAPDTNSNSTTDDTGG